MERKGLTGDEAVAIGLIAAAITYAVGEKVEARRIEGVGEPRDERGWIPRAPADLVEPDH